MVNFTEFTNFINGKAATTKQTRHGINPSTLENLPEVPVATQEDVDAAVEAGQAAFKEWAKVPYEERKKSLLAYRDELAKHKEEFAKMLTAEQGKPIHLAQAEFDSALYWIDTLAKLPFEEEVVEDSETKTVTIRYTPLGVVVGIVPWNFPIQLAIGKIAPSVLTGNPIIVKPSPFTPYSGLKLVEVAQKVFPPGVVQGLSGDDSLGPWLTAHPGPAKISSTGSSATGKKVMESASKTLKRVTLELGGKDPAIICGDIDIPSVAQKIATFAFLNSGQICIAIKRIYVHESIYDEFRQAITDFAKNLKVGDGNEAGVFLGPIQNSMQYERVKGFFSDIEKSGQTVAFGGKNDSDKKGYFINPTIIDNPKDDSRIVTEEPFGPIVPLMKWSDEDEVVRRANDTRLGLGASVWSRNIEQATRIARQIEAGNVWINAHLELDPSAPFGGHKESGIGVEWGNAGLKSFCNSQTLVIKKKD